MTTIEIDGEGAQDGLLTLVITVVELLVEAMEREAIRRMESGTLTDEEIERLGAQLAALDEEIERLKADENIEGGVDELRDELDGLLDDLLQQTDERSRKPGYSVLEHDRD